MSELPLDHLTDRELLLMTVQKVNDILIRLDRQNGRLTDVECKARDMEAWRNRFAGGFAVVTLTLSGSIIGTILGWFK